MSPRLVYREVILATKFRKMQDVIRWYKSTTGQTEVDMREVAKFAVARGWRLPEPQSPIERLAREFAEAAREEIRHDDATGRPYRANHVFVTKQGDIQLHLWVDIDEAPRKPMFKSLMMRREQMVADGLQLTYDADHWNRIHPNEEPIQIPMDFTDDIEWRKNGPDEQAS